MTILLCGATGSGKTTMSKTLINAIPEHERLVTIEDTLELVIPQPNHVRLLYSKDNTLEPVGVAGLITPWNANALCLLHCEDNALHVEIESVLIMLFRHCAEGHKLNKRDSSCPLHQTFV